MILVDLNVIQDVVERREPYMGASSAVVDAVIKGLVDAVVPAHCITPLHYLVRRQRDRTAANEAVIWVLRHFQIANVGRKELEAALQAGMNDYEDAVVVETARESGCELIVTRNVRDFRGVPVRTLTPEEYILQGSS